jgi:hypothetical protein
MVGCVVCGNILNNFSEFVKVDAALTTLLGFMEEDAKRRGDSFYIGF